jgi:hypothetical protein
MKGVWKEVAQTETLIATLSMLPPKEAARIIVEMSHRAELI